MIALYGTQSLKTCRSSAPSSFFGEGKNRCLGLTGPQAVCHTVLLQVVDDAWGLQGVGAFFVGEDG